MTAVLQGRGSVESRRPPGRSGRRPGELSGAPRADGGTLRAALAEARRRLADAGVEDAGLEAELLLRHALAFGEAPAAVPSRAHLLARLDDPLDAAAAARFQDFLRRRLAREPSAYITGHREFYGLDFLVTPATLIPRPETETLVDAALELARDLCPPGPSGGSPEGSASLLVADVGAGCGAVAVAIAHALPQATVVATDVSRAALAVAAANARRHGVERRVHLLQADLLPPLRRGYDLIVANLPYVKTADWRRLAPEVRDYEPRAALDGGRDGLLQIRRLLRRAPALLRPGGSACLEFGLGQEAALRAIAASAFPQAAVQVRADLAGRPRVLILSLP